MKAGYKIMYFQCTVLPWSTQYESYRVTGSKSKGQRSFVSSESSWKREKGNTYTNMCTTCRCKHLSVFASHIIYIVCIRDTTWPRSRCFDLWNLLKTTNIWTLGSLLKSRTFLKWGLFQLKGSKINILVMKMTHEVPELVQLITTAQNTTVPRLFSPRDMHSWKLYKE